MTTVKVQAGQSILEGYVKKPSTGLQNRLVSHSRARTGVRSIRW